MLLLAYALWAFALPAHFIFPLFSLSLLSSVGLLFLLLLSFPFLTCYTSFFPSPLGPRHLGVRTVVHFREPFSLPSIPCWTQIRPCTFASCPPLSPLLSVPTCPPPSEIDLRIIGTSSIAARHKYRHSTSCFTDIDTWEIFTSDRRTTVALQVPHCRSNLEESGSPPGSRRVRITSLKNSVDHAQSSPPSSGSPWHTIARSLDGTSPKPCAS